MDGFDRLARDTTSSATTLFSSAETLLRDARQRGQDALRAAAERVVRAQPSMGAMWNLAAAALGGEAIFERFAARAKRAPEAISRVAARLLEADTRRVVTCSRSASVELVIGAMKVPVRCAESRPGLEGRALAEALARASVRVTVVSDAAIASDFAPGDVVLVGADAIAPEWFVNKVGTGQLCAAAMLAGVPAYVVSGREKCIPQVLATSLPLREDDSRLMWENAPDGVSVSNPLFERVPLDRVSGVITDSGMLSGDMIGSVCESTLPPDAASALADLMQFLPDRGKAG